jgi:hypothetical protein
MRGLRASVILLLLCAPRAALAAPELFPGGRIFPEPYADPRESRFGFDWVESGRVSGRAGRSIALVGVPDLGVRIDGMLWAWLRQTPGFNFPLETVDGQFGMALEGRAGTLAGRLRYGHASSHRADGSPEAGMPQVVWSRETITLLGAWSAGKHATLYAGPTFMLRGEPDAPAFTAQLGGSARLASGRWAPYAAADLRMKAEFADRVNQSYEVGVLLDGPRGPVLRVAAGYESGVSERGQAQDTVENFFRLGITLGD